MTDDWAAGLEDLAHRRAQARAMGGDDRLRRHREAGKLDARTRLEALCDPGSFVELGTLAGDVPADAFVAGTGAIDGRPVMVGAEDFTTVAGTIGPANNAKRHRIAELALADRIPLVMCLEGAGFRPAASHGRSPTDLLAQVRCSGKVPVAVAVLGPSAGHGALIAPVADFTVMTRAASIFTAGPPVVRESLGEQISKEDLGGPSVAIASGLIHNLADDDAHALAQLRAYLEHFPSSAWSYPPSRDAGASTDTGPRRTDELLSIVPRDGRRAYDMREVIGVVVDDGRWFEVQAGFGQSVVCGLAHLGGEPVAIVANQPMVMAGALDTAAADKAAHFIAVADRFHLPLVFLTDNPGMLPGSTSERTAILRAGARMFAAESLATTPKVNLTLRKAYGFGSMVMSMISFDHQAATFAYPGVTLGAMSAEAMTQASGADADAAQELRRAELDASYRSAQHLGFDEMIDPRETRNAILGALRRALWRRQAAAEPVELSAITP